MGFQIFDKFMQLQSQEWLEEEFGPVEHLEAPPGPGYRLAALVEIDDLPPLHGAVAPQPPLPLKGRIIEASATIIVQVLDEAGEPVEGVRVARRWPDETLSNLPPELVAWGWTKGVYGDTNPNGDIGFGMGTGDYYFPPDKGASAVWVEGPGSDGVDGLGMIGGTNHRHLNLVYQWMDEQPPDDIEEHLQIIEALACDTLLEAGYIRDLIGRTAPGSGA